jgi:hypothetical protein
MYSKMIWYLDPEDWQMRYSDRYDRSGRLWKIIDQIGFVVTGKNGIVVSHFNAAQAIDVQRIHSTTATTSIEFGGDFDENMFTPSYLQKYGY